MSVTGLFSDSREQREQRLMEQQFDQSLHQNLQSQRAYDDEGTLRREYLNTLVEHGIDESTALLLRNMLSKDYVLANYTRAEVREVVWLTRVELLKVKGQHPMPESVYEGEYRQFAFDNADQGLKKLDPQQETLLSQALQDIFARVSRGEGGFQQDAFSKTISEVRRVEDEGRGGGGGGILFE